MADAVVEALILDLLEWIGDCGRSYEETMAAWRTSCPKLPVWEDANDLGLIELKNGVVRSTATGLAILRQHRALK